jgi:carboxylate-amine ligase
MDDLQMIGRRNMLCGMHVHVELPDPETRVDVMTRMLPYVPLLIALSTSSPFWRSRPTGLQGYRLAAYDELPRTGIPELFKTKAQFDAYSEALVRAGVMPDSSYIWWAIRPSLKHPTLELRAPDSCTRIEDSIAIASLYRSLARRLSFNPWQNWDMNAVSRAIIVENKWRAQRYGVHGTFAKIEGDGPVTVAEMLEVAISQVKRDAEALGCLDEVLHCRRIIEDGTSADRQIGIYDQFSDNPEHALRQVADWLTETTLQ